MKEDTIASIALILVLVIGLGSAGFYVHTEYQKAVQNELEKRENGEVKQVYVIDTDIQKDTEDEMVVPMILENGEQDKKGTKTTLIRLMIDKKSRYARVDEQTLKQIGDREYITIRDYSMKYVLLEGNETKETKGEPGVQEGVLVKKTTVQGSPGAVTYYLDVYVLKDDYRIQVDNETYKRYEEADKVKVLIEDDEIVLVDR